MDRVDSFGRTEEDKPRIRSNNTKQGSIFWNLVFVVIVLGLKAPFFDIIYPPLKQMMNAR